MRFLTVEEKEELIEKTAQHIYVCPQCGGVFSDFEGAVNCCRFDCVEQIDEDKAAHKAEPYD